MSQILDKSTVAEALEAMRWLPLAPIEALVTPPVLVLAPHADDESLGCGGLIAECCALGIAVNVLVLTDGIGSHPSSPSYPPARLAAVREREAQNATAELGLPVDCLDFLRLPDRYAPHDGRDFDVAVTEISRRAMRWDTGTILAPWRHDPHCDHLAAHLMAVAVAQRLRLRHVAYPVWGWTLPPGMVVDGEIAGARLDVSAHLDAKQRAIAAHRSQTGDLITDDPEGFALPRHLLAIFEQPYEVYLSQP